MLRTESMKFLFIPTDTKRGEGDTMHNDPDDSVRENKIMERTLYSHYLINYHNQFYKSHHFCSS